MERTESILVADLCDGDMTALAILVDRHKDLVYRVAMQITKNSDDASDVLQDAFLKVYDSINAFRQESAFETWLYRIVVNLSIDAVKKRKRQQESMASLSEVSDVHQSQDIQQDPTRQAERNELQEWVTQAVNSLSIKHRAVVILHELEGLSHPQISDILDCSEGTVRSRLHYARKRLRVLLAPYIDVKGKQAKSFKLSKIKQVCGQLCL